MTSVIRTLCHLALVIPVLVVGGIASAADEASGTMEFESTKVALGVGVEWGSGVLTLNDGSKHDFKVEGLSVIDVGVSKIEATGTVYNLKSLKDFSGSYSSGQAGAAVGVGKGAMRIQSAATGVAIDVKSDAKGLQFTLAPGGMKIELVQ